MTGPALWYLTRGTGIVLLVLLTTTAVLGLTAAARVSPVRWPRFVSQGLHRNVSLLAVVFLAAHVTTTVLDSYTSISLTDALVPFVGSYRPVWLGLGALASDLVIALVVTSLVRVRLGYRSWRAVHWLAYAAWPTAVAHGLGTGSDSGQRWAQGLTVLCVASVVGALTLRVLASEPVRERLLLESVR